MYFKILFIVLAAQESVASSPGRRLHSGSLSCPLISKDLMFCQHSSTTVGQIWKLHGPYQLHTNSPCFFIPNNFSDHVGAFEMLAIPESEGDIAEGDTCEIGKINSQNLRANNLFLLEALRPEVSFFKLVASRVQF